MEGFFEFFEIEREIFSRCKLMFFFREGLVFIEFLRILKISNKKY